MNRLPKTRGFTAVELLVVAGIISVLSIIIILAQSAFNKSLILSNTASDIALSLHNTQLYGIGSRTFGAQSNVGYGLDFFGDGKSYIFFRDTDPNTCNGVSPTCKPGNNYYTSSPADSIVQTYTLGNSMRISKFCAIVPGVANYCNTNPDSNPLTVITQHVSIVFSRPNTFANIAAGAINAGTTMHGGSPFTEACLIISSPFNTSRALRVTRAGYIALIQSPGTCP